jgi:hypothetical protein
MSQAAVSREKERCVRCERTIELCACCERPNCGAAICRACLDVALGQTKDHPHDHGG